MYFFSSIFSSLFDTLDPSPGSSEDLPLETYAVPGLTTLLDVALYNSVEGQLTATVCSSHNLLKAWLDLKRQAITVLKSIYEVGMEQVARETLMESFARACLEASCDAIENLTTDRFSHTANLSDPYKSTTPQSSSSTSSNQQNNPSFSSHHQGGASSHHPNPNILASALKDSAYDIGRRIPLQQRGKDCWESPRLYCPDYFWADDAAVYCHRLLNRLLHHDYITHCLSNQNQSYFSDSAGASGGLGSSVVAGIPAFIMPSSIFSSIYSANEKLSNGTAEREASVLLQVVCHDIPARLIQFRSSIEAEAATSKRLYLIKSEYRAPFRAFLEAHQSQQRAPSLGLVDEYLKLSTSTNAKIEQRRTTAKNKLQKLLGTPVLVEALTLEQQLEEFEIEMSKQLYSFTELARYLEYKRARLKAVSGVLRDTDLPDLQATLHCLKGLLCRGSNTKGSNNQMFGNADSSSGIRPLLVDLQGIPRDDGINTFKEAEAETGQDSILVNSRLDRLIHHLQILGLLCQTRNAFRVEKKNSNAMETLDNVPAIIVRGCAEEFDAELFRCQVEDWCTLVHLQHNVVRTAKPDLDSLAESIRLAEMQVSLAAANSQSLEVVMKRLQQIASDREKRFQILQEMVEDICLREMNLQLKLLAPDPDMILALQPTSALGLFGLPLQIAGEKLPIG